ncbi:MAG: hypothetical protein AAF411_19210 [Myxococcota bacterium]
MRTALMVLFLVGCATGTSSIFDGDTDPPVRDSRVSDRGADASRDERVADDGAAPDSRADADPSDADPSDAAPTDAAVDAISDAAVARDSAVEACTPGPCNAGRACAAGMFNCVTGRCEVSDPLPAGTVCRAAVNRCDSPEFCNGSSLDCPPDARAPVGTICGPTLPDFPCFQQQCTASGECRGMDSCPSGQTCCDFGCASICP